MAFQLSPGVVVTEEDKSIVVPQVATAAGALAGAFQWGPVNKPTTVDTEGSLVGTFGKPDDTTAGYFFTAANFLSYGNNLKVVRVVNKADAKNAVSNPIGYVSAVTITNSPNTFTSVNSVAVTFDAPPSGTTARGNVTLSSTGGLNSVSMVARGFGYNTPPTISFEGGSGSGATAVATLSQGEIADVTVQTSGNNYTSTSNIVIEGNGILTPVVHYKLKDIIITTGGARYNSNATVSFSGGDLVSGGNHANGTLTLNANGTITAITITNNGNGYLTAPTVTINRNDEANASIGGNAEISANIGYGYLNAVTIVSAGSGYTTSPNVTVNKNNVLGGTDATISVRIEAQIDNITVTNRGSGFTSNPNVVITPATQDLAYISSNARASAEVGYSITGVTITTAGSDYTSAPGITLIDTSNVTATATTAISLSAPLIENEDDYLASHSTGGFGFGEFAAKYPGTLGNAIKVSFADSAAFTGWQYASQFDAAPGTSAYVSARSGSNDEMHVIVVDSDGTWTGSAGSVLEKFSFLSKASDAKNSDQSTNYYKDVINNQSNYIWALDHPTEGTNWGTTCTSKTFTSLTANVTNVLSGGSLGSSVSSGNVQAGYQLFSNDELYDVSLMPMGPTTDVGVVNTVIGIAEARRDCVVFVSPEYTDVVNTTNAADNIVEYRNSLTNSSFAVLDSGWKYQYDRYNDKYRYVPLNGDVAGLSARTDYVADPWFSPAGYNRGVIKNVVKLAYSPSKTDRDTLYKKGINPVVTFPGQGTLLFGDKTLLARPSAFDRINVRRLFIVLEKAVSTAAKFQLFEFNDSFTRAQFRNLVEPFLRDVQGRRGITDFRVVCDETNNTAEIVDRNEFVADIYIKPARAINFIQLNFVATRSGVAFEEVGA